ncbi:MAG: glycosyltransferase family 2 protein [Proteobacteria bacterium]|nr:glycosyltransferase family 2 protein [Pseudomonadota bacterium]MBU1389665.1 glycosyltransferase family 2 protein [Pseudomonadota bacterium]MBU1542603.1 glycosyltransferase family 2 protein [Pseudomonadota bacterium]MBU2429471.1 glycosyltransferase family 2 protein [Pseudomonadota bacterium]MBU2481584.1 glycosyltransferase family 2 protein [Pseudomonadota bacterium]
MSKLSVYIIAFNEEEKIRAALESVQWADEIIVADSFSTDNTAAVAQQLGARVIQIPFNGFGELRNTAIAACTHDWIFSLDSDERCTLPAREEILEIINAQDSLDAYYVPRKNYFMGRWIKHSGFYPDYRQPQLFRKGALKFMPDAVHERYEIISEKKCGYFTSHINQVPFKNLEELIYKANRYSTLGAQKLLKSGRSAGMFTALAHGFWAAFTMYVFKLGFLDGWPGFVIAFGNFEGTFYKYAKLYLSKKGLDSFLNTQFPET